MTKAMVEARGWQSAQMAHPPKKIVPPQRTGEEVHLEALLCFSDAAWLASSGQSGLGWIIKDPLLGYVHQGSTSQPFVASVLIAEALALKAAVSAALDLGSSRLACYSDCKELITLLNSKGLVNELEGVLADIYSLMVHFVSISFHFIPCLENS